jgi:flagellar hook-associated protein FlgK
MVDIVGIGVSGLTAYQKSLATVGNNIANLQTEGYVRQRSIIESAGQDSVSRISLGAGVRFAGIERVYDRFAEENLQRATSDLSAQESLLKELQALQDTIGSSEAGLHGAFEEFFGAVRGLEVAPASVGARAGFLAAADGVALRFRNLGSAVEGFDEASRSAIDDSINKTNSLLQQLAAINKQLSNRGSASEQPMQLLDKRDAILGDLAEQIGVTVSLSDNGAVTIYAGESASGAALVEASREVSSRTARRRSALWSTGLMRWRWHSGMRLTPFTSKALIPRDALGATCSTSVQHSTWRVGRTQARRDSASKLSMRARWLHEGTTPNTMRRDRCGWSRIFSPTPPRVVVQRSSWVDCALHSTGRQRPATRFAFAHPNVPR